MKVKLRVIGGKSDRREIDIKVPEFVIGRGEGVNLRPKSDLISRRHCSVVVEGGRAIIRDFGSRNGTYLNGERVEGDHQLKPNDRLRVGRLQFEVVIDHGAPAQKRPRVSSVGEVGERTANVEPDSKIEESITDWLTEADDIEKNVRQTITETKQFRLDDTENFQLDAVKEDSDDTIEASAEEDTSETEDPKTDKKSGILKKAKPGKLPDRPKFSAEDSTDAASDMLKKFFNRR